MNKILLVGTIFIILAGSVLVYRQIQIQKLRSTLSTPLNSTQPATEEEQQNLIPPDETPILETYTCPSSGYVDCMPNPNAGVRFECTPEAFDWYKTNCPNFKGSAL